MKRKIAVFCALVMIISAVAQSVGAVNVIMNSSFLKFRDQEPVVIEGVTLVPIRDIAEALGLEVAWDDPTDTVTLKKDNFYIELVIGSTEAKSSAGKKTLLTPPQIINGRTMVPLRFIAEELGLVVRWNEEYQRVVINGHVDTQKAPVIEDVEDPTEDVSLPEGEEETFVSEEPEEEETEFIAENYTMIETASSIIMLDIPDTYFPEDTEDEESFAYRSLDGFDAQHTYNWDIVSTYESYADEDSKSGILFIVQELEPYEGEEYDLSSMNQEYPEAPIAPERPQFPEIDWEIFQIEMERVLMEQIFTDLEVEIPEDLMDLETEAILELLGMESEEELTAQMEISRENADLSLVPGYDDYLVWQDEMSIYNEENEIYREENKLYREEYNQIKAVKDYAVRHFQSLSDKADDEEWTTLFSTILNSDEEVRYESIEILDIEGKKVIHATIYAEDPDDEQGTYEYYRFQEDDTLVTIFGGTLYSSEASEEIKEILANMIIQ